MAQVSMPALDQPDGVKYASTITMLQGTAVQRIHGRKRPQRVLVRSAVLPMMGSKKASQRRGIRMAIAA